VPDTGDNCPFVANPTQAPVLSPTITAPDPVTLASCLDHQLGEAHAADICFDQPVTVVNNAPTRFPRGASTVIWTATDTHGHANQAAQAVTVNDTTRPVFTFVPPAIHVATCGGSIELGKPSATDDCGGTVTFVNDAPRVFPPGTTTVTWTAIDEVGNRTPATQLVTVDRADTTRPRFTFVPPAITISSCRGASIGQATATDNCEVTVTSDAPPQFPLGTTTVIWTAADASGNKVTARQLVTAILADDASCCPVGSHLILGTEGRDTLRGTAGNDCILGLGGDDIIDGLAGNDAISGGAGRDTLQGSLGNDIIFGGPDDDVIAGGPGDDVIDGGPGVDTCAVGTGSDRVSRCEVTGP
jgi:Ca2+-binding RTX toxin-like protein